MRRQFSALVDQRRRDNSIIRTTGEAADVTSQETNSHEKQRQLIFPPAFLRHPLRRQARRPGAPLTSGHAPQTPDSGFETQDYLSDHRILIERLGRWNLEETIKQPHFPDSAMESRPCGSAARK